MSDSKMNRRVAFVGLGAMGSGMAQALAVKGGFHVVGYDVYPPSVEKFVAETGGEAADSPAAACKGAFALVVMVINSSQADSVLFDGDQAATTTLAQGSVVILCSTVPPAAARALGTRLEQHGLLFVDAPVSGGTLRARSGDLTIMAAGSESALSAAEGVLHAMSANLHIVTGGAGAGSSVKMVNQLLAGVHIAAAAEAMALGARAGLDTRALFDVISGAAGNSWMFSDRVPRMLSSSFTPPKSALDIFVKDLGIVLEGGKELKMPTPIAAMAHQQFVMGAAMGMGRMDDSALVKVFEKISGVSVAAPPSSSSSSTQPSPSHPPLSLSDTLARLPAEHADAAALTKEIQSAIHEKKAPALVALDDDPTGTQTVHGIVVLTEWSVEALTHELESDTPGMNIHIVSLDHCFFVLTNTRALAPDAAASLVKEICANLAKASARASGRPYTVVLRGDSTLRGHFPGEMEAAAEAMRGGSEGGGEEPVWLLCPFFRAGGRVTVEDVHYVADGDTLVPAGETEFARDPTFCYISSDLKSYIAEKSSGRLPASSVTSISIQDVRVGGPEAVCEKLMGMRSGTTAVANAVSDADAVVIAAAVLRAEERGRRVLCRTAASFVSARMGVEARAPLTLSEVLKEATSTTSSTTSSSRRGALLVCGSHVPKTTAQLNALLTRRQLERIELSATKLSSTDEAISHAETARAAAQADRAIREASIVGRDVLLMTSRELVLGKDGHESLAIAARVSAGLVRAAASVKVKPRYVLAKGGITSSDVATKALGITRAIIAGQAAPGVPVWVPACESARLPGVPYVVDALADVVEAWAASPRASTLDVLTEANAGRYAVGAFNVYNLEGVLAVIKAAEAERSPAIVQLHPAALKHGGDALVRAAAHAVQHASAPVSLHLDHATDEALVLDAIESGCYSSVMIDASASDFGDNVATTKRVAAVAREHNVAVEAELGRIAGREDGIAVEELEAKMTGVEEARRFISETGIPLLAVCVGNVHGAYPPSGPNINLSRLRDLRAACTPSLLVLHGASGLDEGVIRQCIEAGVCKFNVNTEVRKAGVERMKKELGGGGDGELVGVLGGMVEAMAEVVAAKMRLFGSSGKA
eukprot:jgi/Chlat1/7971/Chrsp69S07405